MKTPLILDLDTGIDDTIALFLAAVNEDVELLGVVSTYGNVSAALSAENSLKVLSLAGRYDVPVFIGRRGPLNSSSVFEPDEVSRRIHGENGTGNVTLPESGRKVEAKNGIEWLGEMFERYGENLVYVTTGPMTNLASLLLSRPELKSSKCRVVSMGGALTVRGNVSHFAEANIHKDPESAKTAFESGLDITMVGLDVTMRSRLRISDAEAWRSTGTEAGTILSDMLLYYIENTTGTDDTYIHDPSALCCALHPEWFTLLSLPLTVETEGSDRGRTVVDGERILEKNPRAKAAVLVESCRVESFVTQGILNRISRR